MLLNETQRQTFANDGVVCLRSALSSGEVASLARSIDAAVAAIGTTSTGYDITAIGDTVWRSGPEDVNVGKASQYNLASLADYVEKTQAERLLDAAPAHERKGRFMVETGTWTRDAAFRAVATSSALAQISGELLGAQHIRFYDDQIFVKEPGTVDRTAFHQDLGYFNIEGDQGCVVWAPVDPANRDSGVLGYAVGDAL